MSAFQEASVRFRTAAILTGFTFLFSVTVGWSVRKVWDIFNLPQSDVVSTEKHGGCKEYQLPVICTLLFFIVF
jgi:hypothetical protein